MALPQVAILSNPWCEHNKKHMPRIRAVIAKSKNIFHFELDEDATIPEALSQFARTKPTLLIINGGDSTIHTSINFLINEKPFEKMPVIAMLATGRANKLAHDLGLDRTPSKVLERLINLAQVEGMDEHSIEKPMIKLTAQSHEKPFYGVYFKGGMLLGLANHFKAKLNFLPLPKMVRSFFAYFAVFMRVLWFANKTNKLKPSYVPESRVILKGAGDIKGYYFAMLATTLNALPYGRRPFGRFGNGIMGFGAVNYGFSTAVSALIALIFNRIGKVSIQDIETRRSDEIIMTGATTVSLDDELIKLNPEEEVTLSTDESLTFISLKKEKKEKSKKA